mgnify:CR=1 FL=1
MASETLPDQARGPDRSPHSPAEPDSGGPAARVTRAGSGLASAASSLNGADHGNQQDTRMLFLGDESLADGFRLIGFETHPDPEPSLVDQIFTDLIRRGDKAFAIVDEALMRAKIPGLERVRAEGGRVVVAAVPRLREKPRLASDVADRLDAMFGKGAGAK